MRGLVEILDADVADRSDTLDTLDAREVAEFDLETGFQAEMAGKSSSVRGFAVFGTSFTGRGW